MEQQDLKAIYDNGVSLYFQIGEEADKLHKKLCRNSVSRLFALRNDSWLSQFPLPLVDTFGITAAVRCLYTALKAAKLGLESNRQIDKTIARHRVHNWCMVACMFLAEELEKFHDVLDD